MHGKNKQLNYSSIASMPLFRQALEEDEEVDQRKIKHQKNGSINYVALMAQEKEIELDEKDLDAMLEDEDVDNYDAHYESNIQMRNKLKQENQQDVRISLTSPKPDQKTPKYFERIQKAAAARKHEQWLAGEKMASRQLKREGVNQDNTEVFMTEEYKKKLAESKEFEKLQALEEEYNNVGTAKNKNDMSAFFKEMYNNDMVFGGPKVIDGQDTQATQAQRTSLKKLSLEDYIKFKQEEQTRQGKQVLENTDLNTHETPPKQISDVERQRSRSRDKTEDKKDVVGGNTNHDRFHKNPEPEFETTVIGDKNLPTSKLSELSMQVVKKDLDTQLSREEKIRQAKERLLQRRQHQESTRPYQELLETNSNQYQSPQDKLDLHERNLPQLLLQILPKLPSKHRKISSS